MTACTKVGAVNSWAWRWGLSLLLLLPGLVPAAAQETPPAELTDSVNVTLTARHRRVPGSTFYVRPAEGYAPEESLNGLAKPGGALLEVMRVPNADFRKIRSLIVQQYLAEKGARVQEQRELTFNGLPAVFGRGESLEPGKDLMVLAFGDSSGIELVFGLYPDNDAPAEAELRQMLLTGYYDPLGKVPPLELAPFVISLAGTPYQLQEVRPAEKLYVFGPGPTASADSFATRFTVQVLPPKPPAEARQLLLAQAQALTTPGATLQSEERRLLEAPGFAYEVSGRSRLRGRANAFYQVVKTDEDATLLLHGVSFAAAPAPLPAKPAAKGKAPAKPVPAADPTAGFRKVAATLRMKH